MSCAALNAPQSFCAVVAAARSRFFAAGADGRPWELYLRAAQREHEAGQGLPVLGRGCLSCAGRVSTARVAEPWLVPMSLRSPGGDGCSRAALG